MRSRSTELAILVVAETECQRAGLVRLKPDPTEARLCYSPGFDFAITTAAFAVSLGFPPKISTTVENTVENVEALSS
jgi:hypothetical protein